MGRWGLMAKLVAVCLAASGVAFAAEPADLQFDFAEGLYRDGLRKEAIVQLQKFLAEHPNDLRASRAHFYKGECHYAEGDYKAALPHFEAAAKDEKLTPRPIAIFRIGDIRFRLGDMAGAVQPLRQFLAADLANPDHRRLIVHARYALARAEFVQRRFQEALALFEQVLVDPAPDNVHKPYVLLPMGDCLLALGKPDDALARYRELEAFLDAALKAKPAAPEAKSQGDLLARVRTKVASILLTQKKHEEALAALAPVDAAGVMGAEVLYGRAQALFLLNRYQEALVPALEYLKRFPDGEFALSVHYIAGECCYRTERFAEAEGHFAGMLAADKTGKDPARETAAFYRAASAYRQGMGRAKETAAAAEAFLKEFPKSARAGDVVYFQAEAAFWGGQYAPALDGYKAVSAGGGPYAEPATHQVAVCLDLLKRYEEAAAAYEDYLKRYATGAHAQSALDRAARLRGQLNQYAKAAELYGEYFNRYANADPKTAAEFLYRKGACEYELQRYDAMFATFNTYFERFRDGAHKGNVLYFLAWYYSEVKGQYEAAVPLYELTGNIPGDYQKRALRLLAHTYAKLSRARLASKGKAPDKPAEEKLQKESDEFALKAAETFLGLIRTSQDLLADATEYLWTAEVFRAQRRVAEAVETFEALIKRFPDEAKPYVVYWLGELSLNMPKPDHERAKRYFGQFVERFPNHELLLWAKFGLAETLKGMGDNDGAWQFYQQVEQLAPHALDNPQTRDALMLKCMLQMGRMAFDRKDWEFAYKYLLRVAMLADGEEAAEGCYKAGLAAAQLKQLESSIAIWSRLVKRHAASEWAKRLIAEADQHGVRLAPDGKSVTKKP